MNKIFLLAINWYIKTCKNLSLYSIYTYKLAVNQYLEVGLYCEDDTLFYFKNFIQDFICISMIVLF